MSRPPGKPRRARSRMLLAWLVMATLFAIPAVLNTATPVDAAQAPRNILPASSERALHNPGNPDFETELKMPGGCDSGNIDGSFATSEWKVTSSIGKGSTVWVGDEWTVTFQVVQRYANNPRGNDGPDPLNLELKPAGPVEPAAAPTAHYGAIDGVPSHDGSGSTGPKSAIGAWGYGFDANSSPKITTLADGANARVTVKMRATAEGVITLPTIHVGGYDGTYPAGPVSCDLQVGWSWTVAGPLSPVGKADNAVVNASYIGGTIDDQSHGSHRIRIPVLANDDDPNTPGGVGNLDELGISDWNAKSVGGGDVLCGPIKNAGTEVDVANLGKACEYEPKPGFSGVDSFNYVVRQDTDQLEKLVKVFVAVHSNSPPASTVIDLGALQNTDETFDLADSISDPQGDPIFCVPNLVTEASPASAGSATINSDCQLQWDNDNPGFTGDVTMTFRACDIHPTLAMADMGPGVTKMPGFSDGDLSGQATSLCRDSEAVIHVDLALQMPPKGVPDHDIVDAGYAGDLVGPYTVSIPVLANDIDGNGPKPTQPTAGLMVLDGPSADQGTATVVGSNIEFTPADGYEGPVELTYRVCEDPAAQIPPYQGFGYCGSGAVTIDVIGNPAPVTEPDAYLVVQTSELIDENVGDNDGDDDVFFCTSTPVSVSAPEKVDHLEIGFDCDFSFDPDNSSSGPVLIEYEVCDTNFLSNPAHPDVPYGADGRSPGDLARRCSVETITVNILPLLVIDPPDEPVDPAPTCAADVAETPFGADVEIDVLANDSDLDIDQQDSPVHLPGPVADDPGTSDEGGEFVLSEDGTRLVYSPADGFSGVDTFEYVAQDEVGNGCAATVTVTVAEGPTDPTDPTTTTSSTVPGSTTSTVPGQTTTTVADNGNANSNDNGNGSGAAATAASTGSLPVTGANTLVLAGLGLVLVAGGAAALAVRSRRTRRS